MEMPHQNGYEWCVSEEPIITPAMKETATSRCRCKQKPCSCIHSTLVNGPPLEYNNFSKLMSQNGVYQPYPLLMCSGGMFQPAWSMQNCEYVETPHVVSSSDQVVRECVPTSRGRKKRDAPISPPVSTSSPSPNEPDDKINAKAPAKARKYVCGTCERAFDYKHVLQNHERTHTGEKPFGCDQCSKRFTRDHHLKTHMRLHTGEKPYKCDYCDKTFVQVANQRRHVRVHTGERPFKCKHPTCTSTFSDSNQLKAHALIHTNEKPFVCPNCNRRYRRRHHLKGHKCSHENDYTNGDAVITNEPDAIMDDSEDSKSTLSDETVSNDSCLSPGCQIPSGGLYQPWAPTIPVMPTEAINLSSLVMVIPEQTEPEDLSVKKKYHSTNNNNSSGSAGDSSRSTSPLYELNLSPRSVH